MRAMTDQTEDDPTSIEHRQLPQCATFLMMAVLLLSR
jgi:hypothetical protein